MTYRTIHTRAGLISMAQAEATGTPINLTAMAVATQQWVSNNVTACTILPGGTTNQVLVKKSNACGDVEWRDATEATVVVDVIEEKQTLAADQTVVTPQSLQLGTINLKKEIYAFTYT